MKRMVSTLVVVSLVLSMFVVPSGAFLDGTPNHSPTIAYRDSDSVALWTSYWDAKIVNIGGVGDFDVQALWLAMTSTVGRAIPGEKDTYAELVQSVSSMSFWWASLISDIHGAVIVYPDHDVWDIEVEIGFDEEFGVYRPYDTKSGLPIVNSAGQFPYWVEPEDTETEDDSSLGGQWILKELVQGENVPKLISSEAFLGTMAVGLNNSGDPGDRCRLGSLGDKYKDIETYPDSEGDVWVYCDGAGRPYVSRLDDDQWVQDDDNHYYTEDPDGDGVYDDGPVEDQPLIDLDSNSVWFPGSTLAYISNLIYDESTKTYYVDAHSEYNVENNTYITNNYHYEYHIDYTSITYIGATEEYNKTYELYYELPDGRSSADLTAEELLALNVAVDIVSYIRSSDNTSLRRLFHFDGNVRDASYWNYSEGFEWVSGASITYMESNAFNGCLYLDETAHEFNVITPSSLGSRDFTLQFRYYQSYTATPQTDSYISISGVKVLEFTGGAFLFNGNSISTPIGSWNEIALIREDGVLYFYLNGVCEGLAPMSSVLGKTINFVLGDKQQTYKQLDEMRILDYALVSKAEQYTPTSVPYDTNLALVLPDSMTPVADEYWIFNAQNNMIPFYDFTADNTANILERSSAMPGQLFLSYRSQYASYDLLDGSTIFSRKVSTGSSWMDSYQDGAFRFLFGDLQYWTMPTFTFSILLSDGTFYSVTGHDYVHEQTPDGGYIGISYHSDSDGIYTPVPFFVPPYGSSWEIVYMEFVEGSTPNTGHEFVSAIAPVNTDFKTPTLAVRTDIDITGYQLGGVRPSLPEEGLVWGMVEDGRITSLQIYNGQAWEQVDGRIWTGSRWVPYYAYDILLLKDLYDIVEADPSLDYIYTEAGFWKWLQSAWGQMMEKLDEIAAGSGGSGSGSSETKSFWDRIADAFTAGLTALIEGVFSLITEILKTLLSLVTDMLSFFFSFIGETVLGGISNFFSAFTDGSLLDGFQQTDESGNTTTQLPEGVGAVFADISGMISALPAELVGVFVFGIALLFLLGVIMLIV